MGDKSGIGSFTGSRSDFAPTEIVVFIGNSADAMADAQTIQALENELYLQCLHKSGDERLHPFRVKLWQWKDDTGTHGGQEQIDWVIDQADAAVFVFKVKSGKITRDEIERCRTRGIEIFACFPKFEFARDCCASADDLTTYLDTLAYKKKLASGEGWNAKSTTAITLPDEYTSSDDLVLRARAWLVTEIERIARERVRAGVLKSGVAAPAVDSAAAPKPPPGPDDIAPPAPPAFHYVRKPYVQRQGFAGRATELALIDAWATGPNALLLFQAIGGMGKSALTWHWMKNHAACVRTDWAGQIWYSFYESGADLNDFCVHALAYIRHQPTSTFRGRRTLDLGDELRRELDQRPWLMILDGLERVLVAYNRAGKEHMTDEEAEVARDGMGLEREPRSCFRPEDDDVLSMLAQAARGKLLASSRLTPTALVNAAQRPIPGVRHVALEGLAPADAEQMLRDAGARGDGWKMRHFLGDKFDCHPLSVGAVAGLVMRFLEARGDFDRWLESPKGGADLALVDKQLRGRQNHILSRAFDDLDDDEKALLGAIALANIDLTPDVLRVLNPKRPFEPKKVEPPRELTDEIRYEDFEHYELMKKRDAAANDEAHSNAQGKLDRYRKQRLAEQKERYEAYLAALPNWQQQAALADEWLEQTLPDLEARGLLQYDPAAGSLDMHPGIRHTVLLDLNPEARSRTGSHVSDALSSRPVKPFEDARTLKDLALAMTRVEALNAAGKLTDGWMLLEESGLNRTLSRLRYHHERLELLQTYLPEGWEGPVRVIESAHTELLNAAGISLGATGKLQVSCDLYRKAIKLLLRDGKIQPEALGNFAIALGRVGQGSQKARILTLATSLAKAQSRNDSLVWLGVAAAGMRIRSGFIDEARAMLVPLTAAAAQKGISNQIKAHLAAADLWRTARSNTLTETGAAAFLREIRSFKYRAMEMSGMQDIAIWHQEGRRHDAASTAFGELIRLANEVGSPDLPVYETSRARSLAALGRAEEARRIAAKVDQGKEPPHVPLALLYLELDEREKARRHALAGYRKAWAEGPPYHHHWDLVDCRKVFAAVGEPEPQLPPFDPAKVEPFDFEPGVERLVDKLFAEKAEREAEEAKLEAKRGAARKAAENASHARAPVIELEAAAGDMSDGDVSAVQEASSAPATVTEAELTGAAFVETYCDKHIWLLADGRHFIDGTVAVASLDRARVTIDELAKPKP